MNNFTNVLNNILSSDTFSLKKTITIFKKELRFFFFSPIVYIFSAIFLIVSGVYFFSRFFILGQNDLREYFTTLPLILSLTIPPITMSLFSGEFQTGSFELISTQSVSTLDIVLGKFLAAFVFMIFALAFTLSYPFTLLFTGSLDFGPVVGGYLGSVFLIMAYSAIGVFASSITKNQIVALVVALTIMITLTLFLKFFGLLFPPLQNIINVLSSDYHFLNIAKGVLDIRDFLYFFTIAVVFIYLSYIVVENRRA